MIKKKRKPGEATIYNQQGKWIKANIKEKDVSVNWGWYVTDDGNGFVVCSKIYGHGILTSRVSRLNTVIHEFESF